MGDNLLIDFAPQTKEKIFVLVGIVFVERVLQLPAQQKLAVDYLELNPPIA
jgi:hypothetical protein